MIRGNVMIVIGRDKVSEVLVKGVEPAAVCDSGETVVFETRDCYDDAVVSEDRPLGDKGDALENPATGPLYVEGALPGGYSEGGDPGYRAQVLGSHEILTSRGSVP